MITEAEACTLLKNSIQLLPNGWACKIPDPSSDFGATIQRPFDMFGAMFMHPWYCEVKFTKGGLFSFDLQSVENHQLNNLLDLQRNVPGAWCWIVYAVNVGRADKRFYVFDNMEEIAHRREAHQNYKQSELKTIPFYAVKKDLIDLSGLN